MERRIADWEVGAMYPEKRDATASVKVAKHKLLERMLLAEKEIDEGLFEDAFEHLEGCTRLVSPMTGETSLAPKGRY